MTELKVLGFLCNWCSYGAADGAGTRRLVYPEEFVPIRVMCSGMVDPQFILRAFSRDVDGVLVSGCHFGDCHYKNGNYKAFRRIELLKNLLDQMGVDPDRLRFANISAAEGDKFAQYVNRFVAEIKAKKQEGGDG